MDKLISIGKILNFHGIIGEVKVGFTAGKEQQLLSIKNIILSNGIKTQNLTIEKIRFHKQYALIKFKEINTVNEVIEIKGSFLKIPKSDVLKSFEEDEFLYDDLVGCGIFDENDVRIGELTEIANIKGQDSLIFKDLEDNEHFLPFVKDIVPVVDIKNKKIVINNIPGLLNLDEAEEG